MIRPLVAGNWKMNLDHVEAIHLVQQLGVLLRARSTERVDVMVLPPFTDLRSVTSVVEADRLALTVGAQHASDHDAGAFTGEVSLAMLARLGVRAVLVGHSERRQLFHMDDDTVARTFAACLRANLLPILCVGEPAEVRAAGDAAEYVEAQLRSALAGYERGRFVTAYEPIWAIGTGATAEPADVAEMARTIRAALPTDARGETPVLYGGSVTAATAAQLATEGRVDGFLVGGASLRADEFCDIVAQVNDCYAGRR